MTEDERAAYRVHTALCLRISRLERLLVQARTRNAKQQRIIDDLRDQLDECKDPIRRAVAEFDDITKQGQ